MKKVARILLGVVFLLVVVALAALFIADSKYQFLRNGPEVSHETLVRPDTSVRIVARPEGARALIASELGVQAPPDWVLSRVLPHEIAILLTPHLDTGRLELDLFCNPQRLGPVISEQSAALGMDQAYPFITWNSNRLASRERGVLVQDGYLDMDQNVRDAVQRHWGTLSQLSRPRVEGSHIVEAVADNRDGTLFALLMTLNAKGIIELPIAEEDLAKGLMPIATVRLMADLQSTDTAALRLVVDCVPQAEPGQITATSFLIGGLLGQASVVLKDAYNVDFTGSKKAEGTNIVADYTLSPIQRLLR
ncbi:MAG: hypothetical protein IT364_03065 [Candidatus Hydrogenedentes bacterium]|nr:hypothetical protein [Candidatus Hydrogenedentota bacterium]